MKIAASKAPRMWRTGQESRSSVPTERSIWAKAADERRSVCCPMAKRPTIVSRAVADILEFLALSQQRISNFVAALAEF